MEIHYVLEEKGGPVLALAIHDGHQLADQLAPFMNLSASERRREEDPFTGLLTDIGTNRFIVKTSRFQVDLNRPIQDSVYLRPDQAWGLHVWRETPSKTMIEQIRHSYRYIQKVLSSVIEKSIQRYGYFIIYDIHSYNAKRLGPDETIDTNANPQINIGTIHNKGIWRPLIDTFMKYLTENNINGQSIDVRENVKFSGGYLSQWITSKYGQKGCVLSIEFRKDFMNEWTGIPNLNHVEALRKLLHSSLSFIKQSYQHHYGSK
ncbi:N-formylglutamate amidohydrolase [Sphingobacterium sp. SRCM116780]|uniref:N-formylglutamate amidohydrolase n=1 Tax=Sphingobacterium sp. SRCM116780 TaxID=2907623 RepID=UPI001F3D834D|nr:N-formylglutamate amidohydrolase [Sphingobacterium sp. SRCM116780]UIR57712.1 N-formylglutamate amidohydrolase [Sphingobacterium sp. SRCM116780]